MSQPAHTPLSRIADVQDRLVAAEAEVARIRDERWALIEAALAEDISLTRIGDRIHVNPTILRNEGTQRAKLAASLALPGLSIEEAAIRRGVPRTWFTNRLRNNPEDRTGVSSELTWERDGFRFERFDRSGERLPDGTPGRQGIRTRITELRAENG